MEYFDLVDIDDNIIGQTSKEEAHTKGQIHRVVAVYVFDNQKRLYLQKHKRDGRWDNSVGGHVSKAEPYDAAAKREMLEELALDAPMTLISKFYSDETARGSSYYHMFSLYEALAPDNWQFQPNADVQHIEAMTLEEIVAKMHQEPLAFTLGFINTFKEYIKQKNLPFTITI